MTSRRIGSIAMAALVVCATLLAADNDRAVAALDRQDYATAWREFMTSALAGDPDAQAGIGAMLFDRQNPPGTGGYADCQRWLEPSAERGNVKGMSYLGRFYYGEADRILAGRGGSAGAASTPQRQAAALRLVQARRWLERAAPRDEAAASTLADMLEKGLGGPREPERAARLRAAPRATGAGALAPPRPALDLAIVSAWRAGRYGEALKAVQPLAEQGQARAQALLGRAFYEGTGLPRDYRWAGYWLDKAAAQGDADALFFLGLMYEHGRGVAQDLPRALRSLDRAVALQQPDAAAEVAGMRLTRSPLGGADRTRANSTAEERACRAAGGVPSEGACRKDNDAIDPYGMWP